MKDLINDEKTLDEALDEFDHWEDQVNRAIEGLSTQEVVKYFQQSPARFERQTGKQLKFALLENRINRELRDDYEVNPGDCMVRVGWVRRTN